MLFLITLSLILSLCVPVLLWQWRVGIFDYEGDEMAERLRLSIRDARWTLAQWISPYPVRRVDDSFWFRRAEVFVKPERPSFREFVEVDLRDGEMPTVSYTYVES